MHSFLNYSINYQIIKSIVLKQKNLVGYSPDYADEMSISGKYQYSVIAISKHVSIMPFIETIKKIRDKWKYRNKPSDKPAKAHYFMYEAWKRSMHIRYTFDAIFIIIVGIVLQVQMNDLQDTGQEWYRIYPIYWTKKMALEDTSLSASDRATAQASFIETEDEYLSIGNRAYHIIMGIYILFAIMYAYALRNVCQIIFAKLRNRTWESIRAEFVLSMMHFIITTTALYRYLTDHRYRTEPDSRYNHLAVIYPAYYEEKFLDMTLI